MPLASAIVLNYRTPQLTVRCVQALLKQTIAGQMEILVIDNHSEDDSIGVLRNRLVSNLQPSSSHQLQNIRIIETPKNLGYGRGNMAAMRFTRGKYILIINPDNELEPTGLETMIAALESDASIGILGPKLVHEDGTIRDSYRRFPTMSDVFIKRTALRHLFPKRVQQYLQSNVDHDAVRDVDWLAGACLLFRKEVFDELGGFDPRFFMFFEDTDLCRRCWAMKKRVVYFPLATATDRKHRLSAGGLLSPLFKKTVRMHVASAMKYYWKWRG